MLAKFKTRRLVLFCNPELGKRQQMKASTRRAFDRKEREEECGHRKGEKHQQVRVGTEWLWFRSGLAGQWALGMKGE